MSAREENAELAAAVEAAGASQVSELEHLRKERDGFRDQRNAVFATNERLLAEVQESDQARLRAENETRTVKRESDALRARVAELEAERHTTNEALDDAVQALRADRPAEVFVPQTERSRWVAIAEALNAAHAAGMPVGIDLDGTLTDHNAWSVVWDREAKQWAVAGYEDGFPALDAESRKTFTERAAAESDSGRRAAWRMLAAEDPHDSPLYHRYETGRDLPETGGAR